MTAYRWQRRIGIAVAAIAPLLAACGSTGHHVATTSAATTSARATSAAPSGVAPVVELSALGSPTVSATCGGGSYRQATAAAPLNGISTSAATGFELTGSNCDTSFTWKLAHNYARFAATVFASRSDSGPVSVAFVGDGRPLPFTVGGAAATSARVSSPLVVNVETAGVTSLTITLPNSGEDAGVLDVTDATLIP